jgi:hypothetical protein
LSERERNEVGQLRKEEIEQTAGCPTCGVAIGKPCRQSPHSAHQRPTSHAARLWLAQDIRLGRKPRRHPKGRDVFYRKLGYKVKGGRIQSDYGETALCWRPGRLVQAPEQIERLAAAWNGEWTAQP